MYIVVLVKPKSDEVKTLPSHLEQKLKSFQLPTKLWLIWPSFLFWSYLLPSHPCLLCSATLTSMPFLKHARPTLGSGPLQLDVLSPDIPILSLHSFRPLLVFSDWLSQVTLWKMSLASITMLYFFIAYVTLWRLYYPWNDFLKFLSLPVAPWGKVALGPRIVPAHSRSLDRCLLNSKYVLG